MPSQLRRTGLHAAFELTEFERGAKKYKDIVGDIDKTTQKAADSMTKSTDKISGGLTDASERAKEFRDKMRGSLQGSLDSLKETAAKTAELKEESRGFMDVVIQNTDAILAYAVALGIALAVVNKYIDAVKDAIAEFQDFANEINRVQIQTGLSAREAALWVTAADAQGVSARSLAAGFAQVSRNLTNMELKIAAGKEDNTNFARTLRAIGIESKNLDGTFKSTAQVTEEVNAFIRELGPGWQAAGVAQNIYGRGAANILPIILDETITLEELNKLLDDGAALTDADVKASRELTLATLKVEAAKKRVKNTLAREWIPTWTKINELYAKSIDFVEVYNKNLKALGAGLRASLNMTSTEFWEAYNAELDRLNAVTEEATEAESKLTAEREAALDALFAETGATDDLAKEQENLIDKLDDLSLKYEQRQEDIALRFSRRWADIQTRRRFDDIERIIRFQGRESELLIKHQQKIADIASGRSSGIKEAQDEVNKKLQDADRDAQLKREKLARAHQDKLVDIRNDYLDSVQEAARSNDAVAVLKARRRAAIATRDEGLRFGRAQRELEIDLSTKREKIREDAAEKKKEEQDDYDEQVARANLEYQRQLAALKRKQDEDTIIRNLKYQEDKHAFEVAKRRAFEDAQIWYDREKAALETQLAELTGIAVTGVTEAGQAIAAATSNAMTQIIGAAVGAVGAVATQIIGGGIGGSVGAVTPPSTGRRIDEWWQRRQGGRRARGGFDIARRPTRYTAGEEGTPEAAIFIPMRNGTLQHNFGNMDLNFNGLPPGMDQSQVMAIVMEVMMNIVQQV